MSDVAGRLIADLPEPNGRPRWEALEERSIVAGKFAQRVPKVRYMGDALAQPFATLLMKERLARRAKETGRGVPDKDLVIVRMGESFGYNRWPELLSSIAGAPREASPGPRRTGQWTHLMKEVGG